MAWSARWLCGAALLLGACAGRAEQAQGMTAGGAAAATAGEGNASAEGGAPGACASAGAGTLEGGAAGDAAGAAAGEAGGAESSHAGAGQGGTCAAPGARFATGVVDHAFGGGQSFNQANGFPGAVLGPPVAGDPQAVVSLGNGGWVVLEFAGNAIVDGPGVDFTVFENPFQEYHELATVAVSDDLSSWVEFPCTAAQDAEDFGACAGVQPVYSSPRNGIDPLDPAVSGGDHFDLADVGVRHARYVRITDRLDLTGFAGVFDLDAVAIVHPECP